MRQAKSEHPDSLRGPGDLSGASGQIATAGAQPQKERLARAFAGGLLVALVLLEAPPAGEGPFVCGRVTDADYLRLAFADLFSPTNSQKLVDALGLAYPGETTGTESPMQLTAYFKQKFPTCCHVTRQQTNLSDDPLEWVLSFFFYKIAVVDIDAIDNTERGSWQLGSTYYIDECGKMLKASRSLDGPKWTSRKSEMLH